MKESSVLMAEVARSAMMADVRAKSAMGDASATEMSREAVRHAADDR